MNIKEDICAIIVTYNCDNTILDNVEALKSQGIKDIIIIDNSPHNESEQYLKLLENKVEIKYNGRNLGLAKALNQGIEIAERKKSALVLTMDQDSILLKGAVDALVDCLNENKNSVSVGPMYSGKSNKKLLIKEYLITSGNLVYMDIVKKIGGFNESLFIDSLDFDFSLRVRRFGKIAMVPAARMSHKIGEYEEGNFLIFNKQVLSHTEIRHYYMYRNGVYIIRKYMREYPYFCCKKIFFSRRAGRTGCVSALFVI